MADVLHSLGVYELGLKRTDEATEFLQRTLSVCEKKLGISHSKVAYNVYGLFLEECV